MSSSVGDGGRAQVGAGGVGAPRNSATDVGRSSGRTGTTYSPSTPSGSRLVAMIRQLGARRQQAVDDGGDVVEDVLAVVEHEQRALAGEHRGECGRGVGDDRRTDRHGDRVGDGRRVGQPGEVDEPHPRSAAQLGRALHGEPRLADAADAGQRHEREAVQRLEDAHRVDVAADEGRALDGQVRHVDCSAPGVRERRREVGVVELPEALGLDEVAQVVDAEVGRARPGRARCGRARPTTSDSTILPAVARSPSGAPPG